MESLEGIWIPLVTPFREGAVDLAALAALVRRLADGGIAGFVVCGSTGEAAALSDDEQHAVLRTVLDAAPHRPVMMGVAATTPAEARERLARLADPRIAAFLVPPPAYVRPPQRGLLDFFAAVADASPRPVVLYDIPARTGVRIETPTLLALAAHPRIVGVKDCSGDPGHLQAVLGDGRLQVLAGDDANLFTTACLGGAGAIAASAHVRPELFVALHGQVARGEMDAARRLWRVLWPLTRVLFEEPSPGPLKAALARQGFGGELRAPMAPASAACRERVAAACAAIDAAFPPAPRR